MPTRASNNIKDPTQLKASRILYVSWVPDALKIGTSWIQGFRETVDPMHADDAGHALEKLYPEDVKSGEVKNASLREMRSRATDVVIVLTSHYLSKQSAEIVGDEFSELREFIQRKDGDTSNTLILWLAPLEELKLRRYKVDDRHLDSIPWWHWLKRQRFLMPGSLDNPDHNALFKDDIRKALDLLLGHGLNPCEECDKSTPASAAPNIVSN